MQVRWALLAAVGLGLAGCESNPATTQPSSMSQRQDDALSDPFNKAPRVGKTDIAGGGINHFDKDAFHHDVDTVLNP